MFKQCKGVCTSEKCKKWCKRCLFYCAIFNNTPFGFLGEHLFWEKIPYLWAVPRFFGIH